MSQTKTVDEKFDLILQELRAQHTEILNLQKEFILQRKDIKSLREEMYEQFDSWDQKFFEFKSQIHDLIDNGFSTKAKAHDEEIEILNIRTSELRSDVEKLNNFVFHI